MGGTTSITITQTESGLSSTFTLTNTGCAENGVVTGINFGEQIIQGQLDDGSQMEFRSEATEDFQAFGGSFIIETGDCAGCSQRSSSDP